MPSALVTKLRKQPKVRDAEALAAWIGRYQKLRKSGVPNKKATRLAGKPGGMKEGGIKGDGKKREGKDVEISLATYNKPGSPKTYVAEIKGTDSKYGLEREFQKPSGGSRSASGNIGNDNFELKEGKTYEISEAYKDRRYVKIENGEASPVPNPNPKKRASEKLGKDSSTEGPTGKELADLKLKKDAAASVPTSLPEEWKNELEIAEKYPGARQKLKRQALNLSKMAGVPRDAAIGKMLLKEIEKKGW